MSLNSFLCKHFDKDADGNVTIGSILNNPVILLILLVPMPIAMLRLFPLDAKVFGINFSIYSLMDYIVMYFNTMFYVIIALIICAIILNILISIWNIKIAKCPLVK